MVLANLSIAFNRLKHDLLIAKLRASGFNYEYLNRFGNTLTFITLAYLKGKKKCSSVGVVALLQILLRATAVQTLTTMHAYARKDLPQLLLMCTTEF